MSVKENELLTVAEIDNLDRIRVVTSEGGSRSIYWQDVKSDIPSSGSAFYDFGAVTVNDMMWTPTAQDIDAVQSLWGDDSLSVRMTVNGHRYLAFKEEVINFNSIDFYAFVGTAAYVVNGLPTAYDVLIGVSDLGIGMFGLIKHITEDEMTTTINYYLGNIESLLAAI